jgi:hypothetical protein
MQDRWRNRQSSYGSHSSKFALLKKDLRERNRQSLYGGSSRTTSISTVPDPLLSSFVGHFVEVNLPKNAPQELLDETNVGSDSLEQKAVEKYENWFTTITKLFSPNKLGRLGMNLLRSIKICLHFGISDSSCAIFFVVI